MKRSAIPAVNRQRRAAAFEEDFGPQSRACRASRCCVCLSSLQLETDLARVVPHHEPPRGRDRKAHDPDTLPLCEVHHDERHALGVVTFWSKHVLRVRGVIVTWQHVRDRMREGGTWSEWEAVPC